MRNLLAFLAAAALTVAGVGWYLGWYRVERSDAAPGHKAVHIDIDSEKIGEDLHKGGERLQEALDKSRREDSPKSAEPSKGETPKADSED
jgi:hypothetical protein